MLLFKVNLSAMSITYTIASQDNRPLSKMQIIHPKSCTGRDSKKYVARQLAERKSNQGFD